MNRPSVSVVLPAFNEAGSLERIVRAVDGVLDGWGAPSHIIIVDDGSADDTPRIADRLAAELPRVRAVHHAANCGYGAAQRTGLTTATTELVCVLPADGQIAPSELPRYLAAAEHADVVVGAYRARPDSWTRRLFSRVYRLTMRALFGVSLRNINAPKLYRRAHLEGLSLVANGGFADAEIVVQLHARGRRFIEVDIDCLPRTTGTSSVGPGAALEALRELVAFRRSGRYRP